MHKASGGRGLERAHVRGLLSDGWEAGTCPSTRPRVERCPLSVHGCIRAPMGRRRRQQSAPTIAYVAAGARNRLQGVLHGLYKVTLSDGCPKEHGSCPSHNRRSHAFT